MSTNHLDLHNETHQYIAGLLSLIETVTDFLIKLGLKPPLHVLEISIFSLNHVISRGVVPGGVGCAMAHPDFGRSVNPISTKRDRLLLAPPDFQTFRRPCMIIRLTKIMNNLLKDCKICTFKVILKHQKSTESFVFFFLLRILD